MGKMVRWESLGSTQWVLREQVPGSGDSPGGRPISILLLQVVWLTPKQWPSTGVGGAVLQTGLDCI